MHILKRWGYLQAEKISRGRPVHSTMTLLALERRLGAVCGWYQLKDLKLIEGKVGRMDLSGL
ncbi:MAG: hypothetical protein N2314_03395 [Brevinematales bacterium]|nr:hypothetical protein [Brevinematales bacterium]